MNIQLYSHVLDKKGTVTTVDHIIATIAGKTGDSARLQDAIERLRDTADPETKDELKKQLPAVTWSGTFSKRAAKNLLQYSGFICIDIDKLDPLQLQNIKEGLTKDQFSFCVFTSPSGNGLKVLIKVADTPDNHKDIFIAIESYFLAQYEITIDPSGKDVSRLCFLSYDEFLYHNPDSKVFELSGPTKQQKEVAKNTAPEKQQLELLAGTSADVWKSTEQYFAYTDGNRNNFLYKFACNCNRKGIDMLEAETFAASTAADMKPHEITSTIRSAYTHNASEWAVYAKKAKGSFNKIEKQNSTNNADKRNSTDTTDNSGLGNNRNNGHSSKNNVETDYIPFWFETENRKAQDKDGNPLKQYNIYYSGLIEFLSSAGYYRLPLPNKSYEFIRYVNNVCDTVPLHQMRDDVMTWCEEKNKKPVKEMLLRGAERYFNANKLSNLPYKQLKFVNDTREDAYFFFKNCYVHATKDKIETRPITELHDTLWQSNIIDHDFTIAKPNLPFKEDSFFDLDKFDCEMAKFVALVSHNPKKNNDTNSEIALTRFYALCSSIGYMLHGWKSKVGKAIVAVDHKIPEDKSEQNGGTGKSIIGESFRYLKSTCIIDGREFKDDYPFRFERIGVDTKITVMQDCRWNLDFGSFFVPVTGDFTYNRRHTGYVTLPYAESPKWWFDTNFVFKGQGTSFRRRMHVIEFDDYFDENHNPFDEFGHYLFTDWDAAQKNLFYNFYFMCVQLYLEKGLIDYPESNYENRKLLVETPQEFIDWMDATENSMFKIVRNKEVVKLDIMKQWNEKCVDMNMQKVTPHAFTKWVKMYCRTKGLELKTRKSNGVEYYTIADANYKGETVQQSLL